MTGHIQYIYIEYFEAPEMPFAGKAYFYETLGKYGKSWRETNVVLFQAWDTLATYRTQ